MVATNGIIPASTTAFAELPPAHPVPQPNVISTETVIVPDENSPEIPMPPLSAAPSLMSLGDDPKLGSTQKVACIMVGLPARGKTYIARKISRYLLWLGYRTKVFNVGNYRRRECGAQKDHSFFGVWKVPTHACSGVLRHLLLKFEAQDPNNEEASKARSAVATIALNDMMDFLKHGGTVAIYDATNSTLDRRQTIYDTCMQNGYSVMFVESICNDPKIIESNIREVKLSSPDYVGIPSHDATADFLKRIKHYESAYQTISEKEDHIPYIKLVDVGSRVIMNKIKGYLQSRIVYYLMNLHIQPRSIYMCRHGESMFNLAGKLGGDSDLSPRGEMFAARLPGFLKTVLPDNVEPTVWTSTLRRTIQTVRHICYPKIAWKCLDELDSGVCDGMTYEEIEQIYPDDFRERDLDKFGYRYKGGESYRDLVHRLEPIIMELERHNDPAPILIVGHQAVLRAIYAYFMNFNHDELPYLKIPLHTVIELKPRAYGCNEERFSLNIPAVDTHRPKPARLSTSSINVSSTLSPPCCGGTCVTSTSQEYLHADRLDKLKSESHQIIPRSPMLVPYIAGPKQRSVEIIKLGEAADALKLDAQEN